MLAVIPFDCTLTSLPMTCAHLHLASWDSPLLIHECFYVRVRGITASMHRLEAS